jgi:hypothetical protein
MSRRSRKLYLFIRAVKQIVVIIDATTYKILSNILLSKLTPYAEEIIGDHQCGFRRNRLTTGYIFCIHQILEKKVRIKRQCICYL